MITLSCKIMDYFIFPHLLYIFQIFYFLIIRNMLSKKWVLKDFLNSMKQKYSRLLNDKNLHTYFCHNTITKNTMIHVEKIDRNTPKCRYYVVNLRKCPFSCFSFFFSFSSGWVCLLQSELLLQSNMKKLHGPKSLINLSYQSSYSPNYL